MSILRGGNVSKVPAVATYLRSFTSWLIDSPKKTKSGLICTFGVCFFLHRHSIFVRCTRFSFGGVLKKKNKKKTHDALPPALRIAAWAMRYNKIVVGNGFIEYDLDDTRKTKISVSKVVWERTLRTSPSGFVLGCVPVRSSSVRYARQRGLACPSHSWNTARG
jgi:hypothetical protein